MHVAIIGPDFDAGKVFAIILLAMDKFLAILIGWPFAYIIIRYRLQIKEILGTVGFAEKIFGAGGTFTLIVLVAVLICIGTLMYALGTLDGLMQAIFGRFFE